MNSTGSVPASWWHMESGAGTGFGGTGNAWSVWGTLGVVVWVSQVTQPFWGGLQLEMGAEDPSKIFLPKCWQPSGLLLECGSSSNPSSWGRTEVPAAQQ